MDVNLQNAYVEVLLDNFVSVIKQNVMFQAQIEIMTKNLNSMGEMKDKVTKLESEREELRIQLNNTKNENVNLKNDANVRISPEEKNRLQSAVNDYMRQVKTLNQEIVKVKSESQDVLVRNANYIEDLNKYIQRLESAIPANKLKKLKTVDILQFEETPEPTENNELSDNVKSGGSF